MTDKKVPTKIFTALDLELNQDTSGAKIIEIGAVVGNIETGEILEKFSVLVNPNQTLTPEIIKLTKIKQEDVEIGLTLDEAYMKLQILHYKHKSFINPIVWSQGDVRALKTELGRDDLCFGRREIDAKTLYVSWRIANGQFPAGGLSRAMANFKLQFKGQAHSAQADAENTFIIYKHMLQYLKAGP